MPNVPIWLYFVAFLAVLGPLVFVHEYGHYIVGRWCGVKADAFSIGFGRKILGWTDKRGTEWKIGWLPLGGYVQFAGDRDAVSQPDAEWQQLPAEEKSHTFPAQPVWKRALIVLAGPVTNFLFAILIFAAFAIVYGVGRTPAVIGAVEADSAAQEAGLRAGDRIVSIDGRTMDTFNDIQGAVAFNLGKPASLEIARGNERLNVMLRPRIISERDSFGNKSERAVIGIRSGPPVYTAVGPLGIGTLIFFAAFISINLGFINLLPLPMLDGGHLAFYAYEAIRRRPAPPEAQEWAFRFGFVAIATLMLVVTFNDLGSIGVWDRIARLIG